MPAMPLTGVFRKGKHRINLVWNVKVVFDKTNIITKVHTFMNYPIEFRSI